ncbi:MAG: hypothetical protein ACKOUT_08155 [Novosphingobium sp.]
MINKRILGLLALPVAISTFAGAAQAESKFVTGTTSLTASANLDFTVTIPKFVYVRIGTGTSMANNTSVDNLVYSVPAANVGDGTAISGTGGDLTAGQVTARVIGNNGTIAFSSTTLGALSNGTGDSISWSQMNVAVATNTSATALSHPSLVDGSTTSINLAPTSGTKVTNLDAKWTFTYKNQNVVAAGTYGGVNTNNGRVTYAVSMP